MLMLKSQRTGFTIVELLIVIVIVSILATISIVAYMGMQKRAVETALKSDLSNASKQLAAAQVTDGSFPNPTLPSNVTASGSNTFQYTSNGTSYCLTATSNSSSAAAFYVTNTSAVTEGMCSGHSGGTGGGAIANGASIQIINNANCPGTRTRAVDARDNHTYWVQKLPDNKCWMLTNLGYAGGGINTYGDIKTLLNGTSDSSNSYTSPKYYVTPSTVNYTSEPNSPSTSTSGSGQYGYLYNWCAAMGGQTTTSACANAATPIPSSSISVCPAGWRLPTGGSGGEFQLLNNAINGGSSGSSTGLLANGLFQYSGFWDEATPFHGQNSVGFYWGSGQYDSTNAQRLNLGGLGVYPPGNSVKTYGFAVRCVAN